MKVATFAHPRPRLDWLVQVGALVVAGVMVASAPLQVLLTLAGAPGGLFVLSAFFTVLLAAPVLMLTAVAPAVTITDAGLTVQPVVWKARFVPWDAVQAVKIYPLLPTVDSESLRRMMVGKNSYRAVEGIMLVIPSLPAQYRIAGFFAGERAAPVIALTSRAHTNYDELVRLILAHTDAARHDPVLTSGGSL